MVDDDLARLVDGDVYDLRIGRCDLDDTVGFRHDLFIVARQVTRRQREPSEILCRREHGSLVGQNGFAECPGPLEILVHHAQDLRVVQQRDDGLVPGFIGLERRIELELVEKTGGAHDVERECRGRQDDAEYVIRVEGDRGDELLEVGRVDLL
jgi:hypothetical protein